MSSYPSTSSTQSAIRSLIFSSSSIATAPTLRQVFARQSNKKSKKMPVPRPHPSSPTLSTLPLSQHSTVSNDTTATKKSTDHKNIKNSLKRFKLFRSKSKRSSKISSVLPPMAVPILVPYDIVDDDVSSICSEVTSVDLRTCSVPNLHISVYSDDSPALSVTGFKHHSVQTETLLEEDEDAINEMEILDNDESDDGWEEKNYEKLAVPIPNSLRRSSLPVPMTSSPTFNQITTTTSHNKRHHRAMSLPQSSIQDLPKSLYHRQPTPSESWDDDFDLINMPEVQVPLLVEETQLSIRFDISNIRDFTTQVEELKTLRTRKMKLALNLQSRVPSTRKKWKHGLVRNDEVKTFKKLEETFKSDWEEANVIIEISEAARDQTPTFNGGKSVELGIDQIPSERHLTILRKIIDEQLGNSVSITSSDDINNPRSLFQIDFEGNNDNNENTINNEENKENQMMGIMSSSSPTFDEININNSTNAVANSSKKVKPECNAWNSFYGLKRNNSGQVIGNAAKKKRRENVRISVDEMPSLIEHLRKLQERLSKHVDQLSQLRTV
ncbi:885_t:CDS:2 [Ambispora gerdemannii]|uniref:885_t:CDS:1 n=1 Tax=Ambispora gerdemannii TaxID=144530 RepID=A0A9N9FEV2_9GLOM|nr:885_t:CDS:2 [Ambispora gerdemannii]